jgi:hypothetical protein
MNTRLTVADVRAVIGDVVNPLNQDDPRFLPLLNKVCERYQNSGIWKGGMVEVVFSSATGFFTLPFEYLSVLGSTYDKCPQPILGQWLTYQENGPGEVDAAKKWPGQLIDLGDGHPTQLDIPTALQGTAAVRIYSSAADNGRQVTVTGIDQDGNQVLDGVGGYGKTVVLASPFVLVDLGVGNYFSKITGVMKQLTTQRISIAVMDGATPYTLSTYEPVETRPSYKRYQTGDADKEIRCICRRRFVPAVNETDWVYPGNLATLEHGIRSLLFEESNDIANADAFWQRGLTFLNEEAKASRGGARPPIVIDHFNGGSPSPWTY